MSDFTLNGHEIKSLILRNLITWTAVSIGVAIGAFILLLILLTSIIMVPLHFILKLCGRRGCYVKNVKGGYHWELSGAFERHK